MKTKFILLQDTPLAPAGTIVTTCSNGGIYRNFCGWPQLIASVNPQELGSWVAEQQTKQPTMESLVGA